MYHFSFRNIAPLLIGAIFLFVIPEAHADFINSMESVRDVIFTRLFPILAVIGVGFAAVSLYTGNPNAKTHVVYAIMASILLFGAQGIIDLIKSTVN